MASGEDARDALAAVAGEPFARLETRWREALRRRPAPPENPPPMIAMRFRHGEGEVDESTEVEERARRAFRLGDLLWDHGRAGAASIEYEKAHRAAPEDPIVASRLGRAALTGGRARVAIDALAPLVARHPEHAPLRATLGSAYVAEGDMVHARPELIEAIRLNPFDPEPHCGLARAAADDGARRRETETCRSLGGRM
jgi:tetratricopeptide (TPR) repeat protein